MGIFSKPEVIILKESSDAKVYLEKLEALLPKASGDTQKQIQKEIAITKAGIIGEDNILFELKHSNMDMVVLHDIYIETKEGLGAQIDFIVVTPKITFVIECKNLFGNIEIDSKGNFIRTIEYNRKKYKEGIYSPITQNERHMMVLKEVKAEDKNLVLGALVRSGFDSFHKSLVVLANPKTVVNDRYAKKEIKEQVLRADQMINVIKKISSASKEIPSSKKEMRAIAEKLLAKNKEERKDYFAKYEKYVSEVDTESLQKTNSVEEAEIEKLQKESKNKKLICPRCGAELVLRTAQKGNNAGQQFYGCSSFPKCRYILNIADW